MKRGRWSITAVVAGSMMIAPCFAQTYEDYFAQYGVEIAPEGGADYAYPERAQPDASQTRDDLSYRVHDVLPFDQDKNAGMYMVIPKAGIVFPVVLPTADDKTIIENGEVFDHFKYLTKGGLRYYGQKNKVVAVHSSYKKSDTGRYKTVGQAFIILRPGDKVFFYYKNKQGTYDFAEYTVTKSQQTEATDIGILGQEVDNYMITAYTCYPVGSSEDRRYINARVTKETENHSSLVKKAEVPKVEQQIVEQPTTEPELPAKEEQQPTQPQPQPEQKQVQPIEITNEPVVPQPEPTPQPEVQPEISQPASDSENNQPQEVIPVDTLIAEQSTPPTEHGAAETDDIMALKQVENTTPPSSSTQSAQREDTVTETSPERSPITLADTVPQKPILSYKDQERIRKLSIIRGILLYKKIVAQILHAFGRQQRIQSTTDMFSFLPFFTSQFTQKTAYSKVSLNSFQQAVITKRLVTAFPNK